jgi:hypothetical protein
MENKLTSKGFAHLAGVPIVIGERTIQRCFICGFKLVDTDDPVVNVVIDEGEAKFYTWEPGSWVRVNQQSALLLRTNDSLYFKKEELPDNPCLSLVE